MSTVGSRFVSRLHIAIGLALACTVALALSIPLVRQGDAVHGTAGASIKLDPASGTIGVGQSLRVAILADSGGEAINAAEADLTFPPALLEVTEVDATTGTFLPIVVERNFDNALGRIRIAGGVPTPGFTGRAGRVATITFRAKAAGSATITFDGTSKLMRNEDNVNVLTGTSTATFAISGTARTRTIVLVIGQTTMTVDGKKVVIDPSGKVAPTIRNGRTLLPVRVLIETLGGMVGWDAVARKATVMLGKNTVQLWIGKSTATVNGKAVAIDAADKKVVPVVVEGRTLLPLRFLGESLGLDIGWNAAVRSVTLKYTRMP
jgi:hypothetical protein